VNPEQWHFGQFSLKVEPFGSKPSCGWCRHRRAGSRDRQPSHRCVACV